MVWMGGGEEEGVRRKFFRENNKFNDACAVEKNER